MCVHVWREVGREGEKEGGRREREGCEMVCIYVCTCVGGRGREGMKE